MVSPFYSAANLQIPSAALPSHPQSLDTTSAVCAQGRNCMLVPNNVWGKTLLWVVFGVFFKLRKTIVEQSAALGLGLLSPVIVTILYMLFFQIFFFTDCSRTKKQQQQQANVQSISIFFCRLFFHIHKPSEIEKCICQFIKIYMSLHEYRFKNMYQILQVFLTPTTIFHQ